MNCRVCICCGELKEAQEYHLPQNPHICASCAGLLAELEECTAPMHPLKTEANSSEEVFHPD